MDQDVLLEAASLPQPAHNSKRQHHKETHAMLTAFIFLSTVITLYSMVLASMF